MPSSGGGHISQQSHNSFVFFWLDVQFGSFYFLKALPFTSSTGKVEVFYPSYP